MRCLFCKQNSDSSHSIEHIIPESLGNLTCTLPAGVVCDGCNNYFSLKVEKPFLESEAIALLRFHQGVPSKRGRVPSVEGIIEPTFSPVIVRRFPKSQIKTWIQIPIEIAGRVFNSNEIVMTLPSGAELPAGAIVSRFLAKVALEAMALRLVAYPEGLEYLVDETQLDNIRFHARRGTTSYWPIHLRQIYDQNAKWTNRLGADVQVVHEFELLRTEEGEAFFVLGLFGSEFVINYGGAEIEGYHRWLAKHQDVSPLYIGRNGQGNHLRRST